MSIQDKPSVTRSELYVPGTPIDMARNLGITLRDVDTSIRIPEALPVPPQEQME